MSVDGILFENVFKGNSCTTTHQFEFYGLLGKGAGYVRLVCEGATNTAWNSINKLFVTEKE